MQNTEATEGEAAATATTSNTNDAAINTTITATPLLGAAAAVVASGSTTTDTTSAITVITNTAAAAAAAVAASTTPSTSGSSSRSNSTNNSSSSVDVVGATTSTNGHDVKQNGFTASTNLATNTNINNNNININSNNNHHIATVEVNLSDGHLAAAVTLNMTDGSNETTPTTITTTSATNSAAAAQNHNNNIVVGIAAETASSAIVTTVSDISINVHNNAANNDENGATADTNDTTIAIGENGTTVTKNHNIKLDKSNQEIIRLIAQYLQDIGLEKSMKTLIAESGCFMEHPAASKFREHVLSGEWSKADADLKKLELLIDNGKASTITEMKFTLLEQKYLEYLDDGRLLDALHVLRNELIPLQHNKKRMPQLSSFIMCTNNQTLHQCAKWDGKGILSRGRVMDKLQAFMPPAVMMPPRRLRYLLQQAVELQTQHCPCHDMAWETNLQNVSLLTDHCCATEGFPMQTIQILTEHCDEVWVCKFSPDGLKLATGCKDSTVIIWDVDPVSFQLKQRRVLDGQSQMSVAFVSWSPDSKMLLVGGPEDSSEICVWNVEDGQLVVKMSQSIEESLLCGAFNRDGTRFVCGGQRGQFYLCDLTGTILDSWEGVRINSVAFRADNKTILAADNHYRIRGYNFENPRADFDILKESHPIMTFSLNSTDRLALLNIANQGLHLWDIEDKCLVRRYQGIKQSNFAIYSCFGGVNESFVASGSEDKLVCIWHIRREQPLAKLSGHTKTVNCVSWNPVYPSLLASASDDATVRIWGPKNMPNNSTTNATPESEESTTSCSSSSSWNMTS